MNLSFSVLFLVSSGVADSGCLAGMVDWVPPRAPKGSMFNFSNKVILPTVFTTINIEYIKQKLYVKIGRG